METLLSPIKSTQWNNEDYGKLKDAPNIVKKSNKNWNDYFKKKTENNIV